MLDFLGQFSGFLFCDLRWKVHTQRLGAFTHLPKHLPPQAWPAERWLSTGTSLSSLEATQEGRIPRIVLLQSGTFLHVVS